MPRDVVKKFRAAVDKGDVAGLRRLLATNPAAARLVNGPVCAFDSPAIVQSWKNLKMVDLLLAYEADINLKSSWWAGPWGVLDHADPKTAKELIKRGAVVDVFAAAKLDRIKELTAFLDERPSLVNAKGGDGCRPLHFASSKRAMDLLLARGADIDARDLDHGATAVQWAFYETKKVKYLLKRGASGDIFLAAALDDVDLLAKLLDQDHRALARRVGEKGYRLCPAAPGRHIYVYLLGEGKLPHQIAAEFGSKKCLRVMKARSTPRDRFLIACTSGDRAGARTELKINPKLLTSLKAKELRVLADTAFHGNARGVKLMLDLGFNPLSPNSDGATALHCAAWQGRADIVKVILNHPAAKKLRSRLVKVVEPAYESTPLGWCVHGSVNRRNPRGDYAQVARLLREAGGDLPRRRKEREEEKKA